MMERLIPFAIFWGVWILIPIIVDGLDTLYHLLTVAFRRRPPRRRREDALLPTITVIIPAHNEELTVDRCINSLKIQDYPHDKLEVIVVDDGSTDATSEIVNGHVNGNGTSNGNGNGKNGNGRNGNGKNGNGVRINGKFIPVGDFDGVVRLVARSKAGKASALNEGIRVAHGELVINIDSDVVLAPHTLRRTAEAFMGDPSLAAATGNIQVSAEIVEERDDEGDLILDDEGQPRIRELGPFERLLARAQFLEYLHAFSLGREAQDITGSVYTLAGAFSAFRREVLLHSIRYRSLTVSEDTDLTLDLQSNHGRVGFIREAVVFVEPVLEWDDLWAQRVRWHRGEIECCSAHHDMVGNREYGALGTFALPKMLLVDHSLAFPRLVWMFLLPLLGIFGYSWAIVLGSLGVMYLFYVFLEIVGAAAVAWLAGKGDTREAVVESLPLVLVLPAYRFGLFFARMSGFLRALVEPPEWTVMGPQAQMRRGANAVVTVLLTAGGWATGGWLQFRRAASDLLPSPSTQLRLRLAFARLGVLVALIVAIGLMIAQAGFASGGGK